MPVQPVQTIRNSAESGSAQYACGPLGAHRYSVFHLLTTTYSNRSEKWRDANRLTFRKDSLQAQIYPLHDPEPVIIRSPISYRPLKTIPRNHNCRIRDGNTYRTLLPAFKIDILPHFG